jgi:hypothetical protein
MARVSRIVPLLLAGVLALQGAAPAFAGKAQPPRRESASIELVGVNQHGRERNGVRFDTDRIRVLLIQVSWKTLVGQHTQRVELVTPDGSVYQNLTEPVSSVTGTAFVETRLPVTGTWITEYDLHGKWTVNVYLDDAVKPVTSERFTLVK